jgi:hypothetical protein
MFTLILRLSGMTAPFETNVPVRRERRIHSVAI